MTGDHNGYVSDYTAICVTQCSYSQFVESNIANTLKSCGGNCGGGGSEALIIREVRNDSIHIKNSLWLYGGG